MIIVSLSDTLSASIEGEQGVYMLGERGRRDKRGCFGGASVTALESHDRVTSGRTACYIGRFNCGVPFAVDIDPWTPSLRTDCSLITHHGGHKDLKY